MRPAVKMLGRGSLLFFMILSPEISSAGNTLKPFTSDGCSISPDGYPWRTQSVILECCVVHDLRYWRGGSSEERDRADLELRSCIKDRTNRVVAAAYYYAVLAGGSNHMTLPFSWGYGWTYKRPYRPLTPDEMSQVEAQMEEIEWEEIYRQILED